MGEVEHLLPECPIAGFLTVVSEDCRAANL
jgi:hypothetical protein